MAIDVGMSVGDSFVGYAAPPAGTNLGGVAPRWYVDSQSPNPLAVLIEPAANGLSCVIKGMAAGVATVGVECILPDATVINGDNVFDVKVRSTLATELIVTRSVPPDPDMTQPQPPPMP